MNRENIILELRDLEVSYGAINALKGVNIKVKEGQIVALLGANGAGKTTTLRTISGLVSPKAGKILFNGNEIQTLEAEKITKAGISQSPEGRKIFQNLSVEENLMVGAFTLNDKIELKITINSHIFERGK